MIIIVRAATCSLKCCALPSTCYVYGLVMRCKDFKVSPIWLWTVLLFVCVAYTDRIQTRFKRSCNKSCITCHWKLDSKPVLPQYLFFPAILLLQLFRRTCEIEISPIIRTKWNVPVDTSLIHWIRDILFTWMHICKQSQSMTMMVSRITRGTCIIRITLSDVIEISNSFKFSVVLLIIYDNTIDYTLVFARY